MATGYSGSIFYSLACSPEPEDDIEEPEIQHILEDMETAAGESGTQDEEEDSAGDKDDTTVGAHPGYPHTPKPSSGTT